MKDSFAGAIRRSFDAGDMRMRLIYINIAVFLLINVVLVVVSLAGRQDWIMAHGADLYLGSTSLPGKLLMRPWSILTYMFTHIGFWHTFGNMIMLGVFGGIFEGFIGSRKLLSTYLLGGFAGFLLYFISFNLFPALDNNSIIVGASAAIMAIVVGLATYMPNFALNLILVGPVKMKYIAMIYVVYDFVSIQYFDNTGGHIGHLGGAAYGFVWAWNLQKGKDISRWFEGILDRIFTWFRPGGAKFRVIRNEGKTRSARVRSDEDFNYERKKRQERMDQLLDKISRSGYDSLTRAERDFLSKFGKD